MRSVPIDPLPTLLFFLLSIGVLRIPHSSARTETPEEVRKGALVEVEKLWPVIGGSWSLRKNRCIRSHGPRCRSGEGHPSLLVCEADGPPSGSPMRWQKRGRSPWQIAGSSQGERQDAVTGRPSRSNGSKIRNADIRSALSLGWEVRFAQRTPPIRLSLAAFRALRGNGR